ncbi:MAG: ParB/RepB/Spo0J family partition protein, partial [bacterium]
MSPARQPLGRGLSALLSTGKSTGAMLRELPVAEVVPNRLQPRKKFSPQGLAELAASIKEKGVATPVIVRRHANGWELIAGERRWRAARQAGLKTIPALVRDASDREALELALVENIQREDLGPLEEATSYQLLL